MLAAGLRWLTALPEADRLQIGAAGRRRVSRHYTLDAQAVAMADALDRPRRRAERGCLVPFG